MLLLLLSCLLPLPRRVPRNRCCCTCQRPRTAGRRPTHCRGPAAVGLAAVECDLLATCSSLRLRLLLRRLWRRPVWASWGWRRRPPVRCTHHLGPSSTLQRRRPPRFNRVGVMLRNDHYQRQHVVTTAGRHGFLRCLIGGIVFSVPDDDDNG